jgi:hypothetical protein
MKEQLTTTLQPTVFEDSETFLKDSNKEYIVNSTHPIIEPIKWSSEDPKDSEPELSGQLVQGLKDARSLTAAINSASNNQATTIQQTRNEYTLNNTVPILGIGENNRITEIDPRGDLENYITSPTQNYTITPFDRHIATPGIPEKIIPVQPIESVETFDPNTTKSKPRNWKEELSKPRTKIAIGGVIGLIAAGTIINTSGIFEAKYPSVESKPGQKSTDKPFRLTNIPQINDKFLIKAGEKNKRGKKMEVLKSNICTVAHSTMYVGSSLKKFNNRTDLVAKDMYDQMIGNKKYSGSANYAVGPIDSKGKIGLFGIARKLKAEGTADSAKIIKNPKAVVDENCEQIEFNFNQNKAEAGDKQRNISEQEVDILAKIIVLNGHSPERVYGHFALQPLTRNDGDWLGGINLQEEAKDNEGKPIPATVRLALAVQQLAKTENQKKAWEGNPYKIAAIIQKNNLQNGIALVKNSNPNLKARFQKALDNNAKYLANHK